MAEAVKVIVRCRPLNRRENDLKCKVIVKMDSAIGQCALNKPGEKSQPPKSFTFDGTYYTDSTTEGIYNDICFPLVDGVLEGYNGTVFAYGQTGCGKSFSMQGIEDPPTQRGIIPRAFEHIFESILVADNTKFLVHASYLEIYNEEIRDLLSKDHKSKLELKEHPDRGVYVKDLSWHPVHNVTEMEKIMGLGSSNRSVGATLMNADSSRSHSIFTINLEILDEGSDGNEHIRAGKLNLVDLAGSERQSKTGSTGDRLKEATKINLSLSALGNVISALVDGRAKHIPYRDSKLTRLLQDSLGGNTKTLMVACLSPADNNYDETLSTLRYANRAKNIKNKPKINEDPKDALLREYQEEIQNLKQMLMGHLSIPPELLHGSAAPVSSIQSAGQDTQQEDHAPIVAMETAKVKAEYEKQLSEMKANYQAEQMSKQKLQEEIERLQSNYNKQVHDIQDHYAVTTTTAQGGQMNGATVEGTSASIISIISMFPVTEQEHRMSISSVDSSAALGLVARPVTQSMRAAVHQEDQSIIQRPQEKVVHQEDQSVIQRAQEVVQGAQELRNLAPAVSQHMQQEALRRLQELQEKMVGGEKKNDQKLKEKRKERKVHASTRREKLIRAVKKMEDDGIMVKVYDNLQDEIKSKNEIIEELDVKLKGSQSEIEDLHEEFERDREDFLETIRKQEQMLKLQQQILDKIQPCIRRDCNYYNIDRVKTESSWDEENAKWNIPELVVTKTMLPTPGIMPGAGMPARGGRKSPLNRFQVNNQGQLTNGYPGGCPEEPGGDKFLQHLSKSSNDDFAASYFKPKRADRLLAENRFEKRDSTPPGGSRAQVGLPAPLGPTGGFGAGQLPPGGGGVGQANRPVRLESLNVSGEKEKKKKRSRHNQER